MRAAIMKGSTGIRKAIGSFMVVSRWPSDGSFAGST
jgi:hypothetical protein